MEVVKVEPQNSTVDDVGVFAIEEINRKEREALVFWLHLGEATWMPFRALEATWK